MFSYIVALVAVFLVIYSQSGPARPMARMPLPPLNEEMLAMPTPHENDSVGCPPDAYSVHIYAKEPLVIYVENFLSEAEREHLLEISDPLFQPSTITHDGASTHFDPSIRLSEVAVLPRTPTVRCIEARARALQGWRRHLWLEKLRTQRYTPGGHYAMHYDWSTGAGGWGRVSSFMVWAAASADLVGGGTEFPYLPRAEVRSGSAHWCRFVECAETHDGRAAEGVVFKAVPGNAVFWENFRADGSGKGYQETFHAGQMVEQGTKVGLNIWTWGALE
ncbi:hypothetical protein TD95_001836 [Thielaviopsis punctulata]|uniref:Prolyl 4-hydroxylase alpha subunit domain-containing protein n=1 Tax=Thielaviopsis punctulata TaxID=72032 RepID=A0A0F4ZDI0_9PEZI|nr:hypothetical protein TD95_001836 [Thielaviopsis punctulata]